jgi:hypothetical protein
LDQSEAKFPLGGGHFLSLRCLWRNSAIGRIDNHRGTHAGVLAGHEQLVVGAANGFNVQRPYTGALPDEFPGFFQRIIPIDRQMVQNDLTGDFDPDSAYPNHLDRMRRGGPSVEALRATWQLDGVRQSKQRALWDQCVQALSGDAETPLPAA